MRSRSRVKPSLSIEPGLDAQHVRACDQAFEGLAAVAGGKIDHHGFLAAVEPDEVAALSLGCSVVAAGEIAFRPLDLVDGRPGVGEAGGTERRSHRLLDGDDGQSFKR